MSLKGHFRDRSQLDPTLVFKYTRVSGGARRPVIRTSEHSSDSEDVARPNQARGGPPSWRLLHDARGGCGLYGGPCLPARGVGLKLAGR